ncbi:MAG: hypothetical protein AAGB26_12990 [Planctomycetota bacterium]
MSEPNQEDVPRKRQASVVLAGVMLIACVLFMLGFAGMFYLWLGQKAQIVIDAADNAAEIEDMKADILAAHQELEQTRIELAKQQDGLRLELEQEADNIQASRRKEQAVLNRRSFTMKTPKVEPLGFPQPIKTGVWTGVLRLDGDKPPTYILPSDGLALIKPSQSYLPQKACAPFTFNQDGSKFFVIDSQSILRRYDSTTLQEEVKLVLGADAYDIAFTVGGLSVSFPSRNKIWMIDPESMNVLGEVEIDRPTHLAATPTSPRVYAIGFEEAIAFDPKTLSVVWTSKGSQVNKNSTLARRLTNKALSFVMHPNGERLMTGSHYSSSTADVHQFIANESDVEYLASGRAKPIREYPSLVVHPDGHWLAVPQLVIPRKEDHQTLALLDANNLKNPSLVIRTDDHITACNFDAVRGQIVAAVGTNHLYTYSMAGEPIEQYHFEGLGEVIRLTAFMMGGRYFTWSNKGMWVIDLDPDRIKADVPTAYHQHPEPETP